MTIKELMVELGNYPPDMQVFLASDGEENEIHGIDFSYEQEFQKTNNNGSFEALVIVPNSEWHEVYDAEADE